MSVKAPSKRARRGLERRRSGSLDKLRQYPLTYTFGSLRSWVVINFARVPVIPAMATVMLWGAMAVCKDKAELQIESSQNVLTETLLVVRFLYAKVA